jgi:endonuclease/exonuclease/phosphatase family metal-dependent hydrolase
MLLSRRRLISSLVGAGTAGVAAMMTGGVSANADDAPDTATAAPPATLRVIAYNVYECTGWPKERALGQRATSLGQMPARFARELALYEPDLINFSESPGEEVVAEIARQLGMRFAMFPSGGKWPGAILSRFEISDPKNVPLAQGERPADLFTRHWGRAVVTLPGGLSLVVHSAHLFPGPAEASPVRVREIQGMLDSMQDDMAANRSMLVLGDLNHRPTPPEYPLWLDAGWVDTFQVAGEGEGLTIKSDVPDARIDYVLARGPIAAGILEARPLFEGAFRVNTSDAESFALSDHLPQLAVFRWPT